MITYVELRYNSPFGPVVLPDYTDVRMDDKYNDLGTLEFTYPSESAASLGVKDQAEISAVLGFSNNTSREVARYIIDTTNDEVVSDDGPRTTFSGPSFLSVLDDAVVYPSNWPVTAPSGHEFVDATFGTIWRTLILRAKNRGALLNINETSFTGTKDSQGADWQFLHSQKFETGNQYFSVLQDSMEKGLIDAWMDGDNLRIVNGGTRGSTIDIGAVEIRPAKNVSDLTTSTQSKEAASTVLLEGEEGTSVERSDAAFQSQLGRRREKYFAQSGVADSGILEMLAEKAIGLNARIPTEETVGIAHTSDLTPFLDFNVGDWVHVRYKTDVAAETRRVRQLAVAVDQNRTITLGVTLGTIIYERDVALARQLEAYTGSGGTVLNNGFDNTVPNPPSALGIVSTAYTTSSGTTAVAFTANWNAPSTNTGGDAYTDQGGFYVNWRYTEDAAWAGEVFTTDTKFQIGSARPGEQIQVSVVAVDSTNHRSTAIFSTHTLAADATPPPKPAAPVGASRLGSVQVFWSGFTATGTSQPKDFYYAELHALTAANQVPSPGDPTRVGSYVSGGTVTLTDLSYNSVRYFKVIAVDRSGNWSAPSDASAGVTVKALVDTDLIGQVIDGVHLKYSTVGGEHLKVDSVFAKHVAIADFNNYTRDPTFQGTGTWNVPLNSTAAPVSIVTDETGTARPGSRNDKVLRFRTINSTTTTAVQAIEDMFPVKVGDKFHINMQYRRSGVLQAAGAKIGFRFYYYDKDGTAGAPTGVGAGRKYYDEATVDVSTLTDTTWRTLVANAEVPVNAAFARTHPIIYALDNTTAGVYDIDEINTFRRNGGELIVDGSITTTKLAALAVEAGNIAANAVTTSKLAFGAATGDRIHISNKGFAVNDNSNMEEEATNPTTGAALGYPAYWSSTLYATNGTLSMETAAPISGSKSAKVTIPANGTARFWYVPTQYIPVAAGEKWFVSVKLRRVGGGAFADTLHPAVAGVTSGSAPAHPYTLNAGTSTEHWGASAVVGTGVTTLTSVVTVPAGHVKLGMLVFLPKYDASQQWVIDEFIAHPAIDDTKVTDITPGKITTGVLAANTRMIAGSETGARAEMNTAGFFAYRAGDPTPTFRVSGADGSVFMRGTFTTTSNDVGRVQISAVSNPYEGNTVWNTIQFFSDNEDWMPGMIWSSYGTGQINWGALQLVGPKLGLRDPARITLRSDESSVSNTSIQISARRFQATADDYTWGDPTSGVVTHRLAPASGTAQRWSFQSAGGTKFEIRYDFLLNGNPGFTQFVSQNSAGDWWGMWLSGSRFAFDFAGTADTFQMHHVNGSSTANASRPALVNTNRNVALVYGDDVLRVTDWPGNNHMPIHASAYPGASDIALKQNLRLTDDPDDEFGQRPVDVVNALTVYDYERKAMGGDNPMLETTARGLIAQDVEQVLPAAVTGEEGNKAVDMYYLICTLWAAVQNLTQDIEALRSAEGDTP